MESSIAGLLERQLASCCQVLAMYIYNYIIIYIYIYLLATCHSAIHAKRCCTESTFTTSGLKLPFPKPFSYLLGLLAMISVVFVLISVTTCDNWYVYNWRLACHINCCWGSVSPGPLCVALTWHWASGSTLQLRSDIYIYVEEVTSIRMFVEITAMTTKSLTTCLNNHKSISVILVLVQL